MIPNFIIEVISILSSKISYLFSPSILSSNDIRTNNGIQCRINMRRKLNFIKAHVVYYVLQPPLYSYMEIL